MAKDNKEIAKIFYLGTHLSIFLLGALSDIQGRRARLVSFDILSSLPNATHTGRFVLRCVLHAVAKHEIQDLFKMLNTIMANREQISIDKVSVLVLVIVVVVVMLA